MKKVTILIAESTVHSALVALRGLGVLHVRSIKEPASESIAELSAKLQTLTRALQIIGTYTGAQSDVKINGDYCIEAEKILQLVEKKKELDQQAKDVRETIQEIEIWGDFIPRDIDYLREQGVYIKLYMCRKQELQRLTETEEIRVVAARGAFRYIALITQDAAKNLPFAEMGLPEKSLSELEKELGFIQSNISSVDREILEHASYKQRLTEEKERLEKNYAFERTKYGMGSETGFSYLQGFCPLNRMGNLEVAAPANSWGLLVEDVAEDEEAPTLIESPFLGKVAKPLFEFMSTVPGYREYDISIVFLLFFSLFFAMLIGDAGYGILFLLGTFAVHRKFPHARREPFFLFYILSLGTVLWGAVSGTWFGYEKIAQLPFFHAFIIDHLNGFVEANQLFIIQLCFTIGVVHLTIAHLIVGVRMLNSLKALGQAGWILILWGLYYLAGNLVLNKVFPNAALWALVIGFALVIFFSEFSKKHPIKGMLTALANLPLAAISSFSDIVSYLRLFAVGYASTTVAGSFNEMAMSVGINDFAKGLGFAAILIAGHSLNIVLGAMAVIVHGIRLNMLEFSGHLGMQWSGTEYKPFKE